VIADLALQTTIVEGLRALKRAPRRIDQLFANLPLEVRAQVRNFLTSTPIHFSHGYPMEAPKLPHVILVLRREVESAGLLGQAIDAGPLAEEEFLLRDGDVGLGRPPFRTDPSLADALIEERGGDFPDERTPIFYGERTLVESVGRIARLTYDAEVRTQDYFATAFLNRVVQALLVGGVPKLEAWGIHDLEISASDVEHTGQEYPHPVFLRTLTIAFQQVFGVHETHDPLRAIAGGVTAVPPGGDAVAGTLSWQITIT
jgi:hypothetical protein